MRPIDADMLKVDWYDDYETEDGDEYSYTYVSTHQIDNAPTIDVAPQWIPCDERLPEKEEKAYLVYLDNGYVCECRWWCLDPVFLKPTDNWRWHFMDKPQFTKVLAWMPLPEPYKRGRDDEID